MEHIKELAHTSSNDASSNNDDLEQYGINYFSEEQYSLLQQLKETLINKSDINVAFDELERLDGCFQVIYSKEKFYVRRV